MHSCRLAFITLAVGIACGADASAQSTYVAASVFGDIVRSSHTETTGGGQANSGGETMGFALRIGTPVGAAWGVEAEFARPSEIENEMEPAIVPLFQQTFTFVDLNGLSVASPLLPAIPFRVRTAQRNTTLSAAAWVQQQFTARVSLTYIAGVGFYRSDREYEVSYPPLLAAIPIVRPSFRSESVIYGVKPLVGLESRISLAGRAQLVPGIRLHGIEDGWLVRPSVGIAWAF